jgi:hypothetical protein
LVRDRRWARTAAHVATVVVVGWFVWWNLSLVWRLRGGRPPQYGTAPIYLSVDEPLRSIARPIYAAIGNPFSLPASAVFARLHRVDLQRWDRTVGQYPALPATDYTPATLRAEPRWWPVGDRQTDEFVVTGAAAATRSGLRWTTARRAVVMVPNLLPEPMIVRLMVTPNLSPGALTKSVVVRWNGRVVVDRAIAGATPLEWTIVGDVGMNDLSIEAAIDPPSVVAGSLGAVEPVGVALGELRFTGQ